jgi:uncharacterized protein DUF3570
MLNNRVKISNALILVTVLFLNNSLAKKPDSSSLSFRAAEPIEIDFLSGYYEQDGNHSAVTGGIGTEKLENFDSQIIINIPLNEQEKLKINTAINYYSSASTDNIDSEISSASANDYRAQIHISYNRTDLNSGNSYEIKSGGSVESDYISTMIGFDKLWNFENGNRQVGLSAQAFFDTWILIFPKELQANLQQNINTDKRRTYNLGLNINQVISKKIQGSISSEIVYQSGFLSTPFHRVYFKNDDMAKIEKFPDERFKLPIGLRLNYFYSDYLILRFSYRYYYDSFGIIANTLNFETPLKITRNFTLYPFYRYHNQTKSNFFKPFGEHALDSKHYTSDYDLSGLSSNKIGMGFKYAPLLGVTHFKILSSSTITSLKSLNIRYSNFRRSDGLRSWIISLGLSFISY